MGVRPLVTRAASARITAITPAAAHTAVITLPVRPVARMVLAVVQPAVTRQAVAAVRSVSRRRAARSHCEP